jgi:hypothetical protein
VPLADEIDVTVVEVEVDLKLGMPDQKLGDRRREDQKLGDRRREVQVSERRQGMTGRREFFYSIKKEGTPASFQA